VAAWRRAVSIEIRIALDIMREVPIEIRVSSEASVLIGSVMP
jgi:hypothetical protein